MEDIIINLDIKDKKYLLSRYCDDVIDPELSNYISNYMIGTDLNSKVIINIDCKFDLTEEEKSRYSNIILKEYSENIEEINYEKKKSNINRLALFLLGMLFISLSYLIDNTLGHILSQVLVIFGWVVLWEVAYSIIFADAKRNRTLKRYKQLYNSKIVINCVK
jgi:hypothetical protein